MLVTAKHFEECINTIAKATNHGTLWQAMGASHYSSDDVFWGVVMQNAEGKNKELMKKKEVALKSNDIVQHAHAILVHSKGVDNYNMQELKYSCNIIKSE